MTKTLTVVCFVSRRKADCRALCVKDKGCRALCFQEKG